MRRGYIQAMNFPAGFGLIKTSGGQRYYFLLAKDEPLDYPAEMFPPAKDDDVEFVEGEKEKRFGLPNATSVKWISRTGEKR